MQNCKHKTVQDGKTSFFSVFRVSCEFAPSQLARLRCSNNLAYRFSSERLLAVYVRVQKGSFSPGGGGDSHMNLTPKGDHLGVAQAFCDP